MQFVQFRRLGTIQTTKYSGGMLHEVGYGLSILRVPRVVLLNCCELLIDKTPMPE